jgi:hypothetical protein
MTTSTITRVGFIRLGSPAIARSAEPVLIAHICAAIGHAPDPTQAALISLGSAVVYKQLFAN